MSPRIHYVFFFVLFATNAFGAQPYIGGSVGPTIPSYSSEVKSNISSNLQSALDARFGYQFNDLLRLEIAGVGVTEIKEEKNNDTRSSAIRGISEQIQFTPRIASGVYLLGGLGIWQWRAKNTENCVSTCPWTSLSKSSSATTSYRLDLGTLISISPSTMLRVQATSLGLDDKYTLAKSALAVTVGVDWTWGVFGE